MSHDEQEKKELQEVPVGGVCVELGFLQVFD
jgi:hypothetical protein